MAEKKLIYVDKYCRDCIYFCITTGSCDYIFAEGKRRGCASGAGCDKKLTKAQRAKNRRKSITLNPAHPANGRTVPPKAKPQKEPKPPKPPRPPKPKKPRKPRKKTKTDLMLEERMALYQQGMNDGDIAAIQGKSRNAIFEWRRRQGLPSNYNPSNPRKEQTK